MISHTHKCIFIHISRTAGTSIEHALTGGDWWDVDPTTKHITASHSREIYAEHWDKYFKFSFIRNPFDRLISCYHLDYYNGRDLANIPKRYLQYGDIIPIGAHCSKAPNIGIESGLGLAYFLDHYKPPPWEHKQLIEYTDIIDLNLDFIGRYEFLSEDFNYVQQMIGANVKLPHVNTLNICNYYQYYDAATITQVQSLYRNTLKHYKYQYY